MQKTLNLSSKSFVFKGESYLIENLPEIQKKWEDFLLKRILLLKPVKVCYDATAFYVEKIGEELKKCGYEVILFEVYQDRLNKSKRDFLFLAKQKVDVIFGINSELMQEKTKEGESLLNLFQAPFYNFIIDHPLYHHKSLKIPRKDTHVICLDHTHKSYVETYYPHIKNVHTLFLTGAVSPVQIPFPKRQYDSCFVGTYTSPDSIEVTVQKYGKTVQNLFYDLVTSLSESPEQTQEAAMKRLFNAREKTLSRERFLELMSGMYAVDLYLRTKEREKVIQVLQQTGVKILICGYGWEKSPVYGSKNITFAGPVKFLKSHDYLADSRISFNVMPRFLHGVHDRVFSGLLNGCVSLTDQSEYLKQKFSDKEDILFYEKKQLETLGEAISYGLMNPNKLAEIVEKGKIKGEKYHTWEERTKKLCQIWEME